MDRERFETDLEAAAARAKLKLSAPIKKAIFAALGERDPNAEICRDSKGRPEADSELRDTENVPLPAKFKMPKAFLEKIVKPENAAHAGAKLPLFFGPDMPNDELVEAMKPAIDAYIAVEVLPHVPDAWADYSKTKVGYEIPINRHFYVYKPPRPLAEIETDITALEGEIAGLLKGLTE
jgi:type I restriction enzyme M protein